MVLIQLADGFRSEINRRAQRAPLTFKSENDRDAYLQHPEHKAFGGMVGAILDDVFVIDFWAKD
jgi:hypothetical protein